ncbi:MAG: chain-length determining protein, partial [Alistipes sp.]|nr:chain-length determining protein [Alistipes sp.]
SATVADTVMRNLQNYVTGYRTNKARKDLELTQQLYDEAQREYYKAQQRYARYMDANQNVVRRSVRTEQERLQNEVTLAYNVYNQMAQQLQLARAKVQESTPVYAVVQPASVPLRAAKPSKMLVLIGFVFMGGVFAAGWILGARDFVRGFKEQTPSEE